MTIRKVIFVNTDGDYEESTGMYETSDYINSSAGVGDAGKPIVLDAAGLIDSTMIDTSAIDHGNLAGLTDDDHTQYTLADGTRAFTGDQSMGTNQLTSVGDPTAATIDAASDDAVPMSFLASTANGEGAAVIGIEDTGGFFTATDVEAALQELAADVDEGKDYVEYTVGTGGVTAGDLVFVSANNTVESYDDLSQGDFAIGIAATTEAASGTVRVLANDEILAGVLTGATAGDKYYWNGSALTTTLPSGSGTYVWLAGVAKNATDLHTNIEFIKRNSL
jgi:hypothetical protein